MVEPMIFHITPHAGYTVKIKDDLRDSQGLEAAGACDWRRHVVWLASSKQVPAQRRPAVLFHELWHCWENELGKPLDGESQADQISAFCLSMWSQLERMGGLIALLKLDVDGAVNHAADSEMAGEVRTAQCPVCNGLLDMPIRSGEPMFDFPCTKLIVWRSANCSFCDHLVRWRETSTPSGQPKGTVIGEPEIVTGRAVPA